MEIADIIQICSILSISDPWTSFRGLFLKRYRKADTPTFLLSAKEKVLLRRIMDLRNLIHKEIDKRIENFQENEVK